MQRVTRGKANRVFEVPEGVTPAYIIKPADAWPPKIVQITTWSTSLREHNRLKRVTSTEEVDRQNRSPWKGRNPGTLLVHRLKDWWQH